MKYRFVGQLPDYPHPRQINNLQIKRDWGRECWVVISPDQRILEEGSYESMVRFAKATTDFLHKKEQPQ